MAKHTNNDSINKSAAHIIAEQQEFIEKCWEELQSHVPLTSHVILTSWFGGTKAPDWGDYVEQLYRTQMMPLGLDSYWDWGATVLMLLPVSEGEQIHWEDEVAA